MKIPLADWAARHYDPAPNIRTLRAWVSSGQIFPAPEKVGRSIMVEETAIRQPHSISANDATMSSRAKSILDAA